MPNSTPLLFNSGPVRPNIDLFPNEYEVVTDDQLESDDGIRRDGAEDGAAGEAEFPKKVRPGPPSASQAEVDHHESTGHAVFRNWCSDCVQGRGRAKAHDTRKSHEGDTVPVISWDYGFLGTRGSSREAANGSVPDECRQTDAEQEAEAEASGQSPVLCMRDRLSHSCFWYLLPSKGAPISSLRKSYGYHP